MLNTLMEFIHSSPLSYKEMAWRPPHLTPIKDLECVGSRDKTGPRQVILSPKSSDFELNDGIWLWCK